MRTKKDCEMKGKGYYYAIGSGKGVGIYESLNEAYDNGGRGRCKKFKTVEEAQGFIAAQSDKRQGIECNKQLRPPAANELMYPDVILGSKPMEVHAKTVPDPAPSPNTSFVPVVDEPQFGELVTASPSQSSEDVGPTKMEVMTPSSEEKLLANSVMSGSKGESTTTSPVSVDAQYLYRCYSQSRTEAEEAALSYLSTEVQHPVISCFREITKADIAHLFTARKIRKSFNHIETSIVCLGMIDYLAICVNNPVYNEHGKMFGKNIPKIINEIIQEFKGVLRVWGLNSQISVQNRMETVFAFLRRLIPCFKPIDYDNSFSQLIDTLQNEMQFKKSPITAPVACLTPPVATENHDTGSFILHEIKINKNIFELEDEESAEVTSTEIPVNKTTKATHTTEDFKNSPNLSESVPNSLQNSGVSETTTNSNLKRPLTHSIESPAKKQKVTEENQEVRVSVQRKGPLKNAFDILMSQSRRTAQQRRNDMAHLD